LRNIEITLQETLEIPLFPLRNTVFFPNTLLPLHIFEPRYRQMVSEVMEGERLIGIVLQKAEIKPRPGEFPEFFRVGSLGLISDMKKGEEGTFDIVLTGLTRFEILEVSKIKPYRLAKVRILKDHVEDSLDQDYMGKRLLTQLNLLMGDDRESMKELELIGKADFTTLLNSVCSLLQISPKYKQALLEMSGLKDRVESTIRFVERLIVDKELVSAFSHLRPEDPVFN
jgi:Lon protease-like protein